MMIWCHLWGGGDHPEVLFRNSQFFCVVFSNLRLEMMSYFRSINILMLGLLVKYVLLHKYLLQ